MFILLHIGMLSQGRILWLWPNLNKRGRFVGRFEGRVRRERKGSRRIIQQKHSYKRNTGFVYIPTVFFRESCFACK